MGNPQANPVAALQSPETPASRKTTVAEVEQPRDFQFAVTWVTLFAHLDLIESSGPRPRPQPAPIQQAPILDLVPVTPAPLVEPDHRDPGRDPGGGWEMVVPKMIRTGPGQFTRVDDPKRDS
jgi:hypothetical protein